MIATLLPFLNLAAETGLVVAVLLLAAFGCSAPIRVLLFRCAFVIALAAPAALFVAAPKIGAVTFSAIERFDAQPAISGAGARATPGTFIEHARPLTVPPLLPTLGLIWFAGVLIVIGRHLLSLGLLSRTYAAGSAPSADIERKISALRGRLSIKQTVSLRLSDRVPAPCTFGWLYPKVLAPVDARSDALDSILAHELCHIRNRDALWLMLGCFACALHWFNPLVWICARRHRDDIELVCDDAAVRSGLGVDAYVTALVQAAHDLIKPKTSAAVMMSSRGLSGRVRTLLERRPMSQAAFGAKLVAVTFSLAAIFAFGNLELVSASAGEGKPAHEPNLESMLLNPPERGNGRIFMYVAPHIRVVDDTRHFGCWDGAGCQFELRLGTNVVWQASANVADRLVWSGCEPSADARTCRVQITDTPVVVRVRLVQ